MGRGLRLWPFCADGRREGRVGEWSPESMTPKPHLSSSDDEVRLDTVLSALPPGGSTPNEGLTTDKGWSTPVAWPIIPKDVIVEGAPQAWKRRWARPNAKGASGPRALG